MSIQFEWDSNKNSSNRIEHKVSFEEALTVFYDENARLISDPDHSKDEERFIILGLTERLRLLVVSHCYREHSSVIRIISARKANKKEEKFYREFLT